MAMKPNCMSHRPTAPPYIPKKPKQSEELPPIIQDFLRHMRRYRDPAYKIETRRRNERKAWQIFSIMTADAQRLALSLITLD